MWCVRATITRPENLRLLAHRDALKRANILHCDISLFNLLLVVAIHSNISEDFLDQALQEPEKAAVTFRPGY